MYYIAAIIIAGLLLAIVTLDRFSEIVPDTISNALPPDNRYTVTIHNNSPHPLTDIRIFGGGRDEHILVVEPGDTTECSFMITEDGKLEFTARGDSINGPTHLDKVIDEHLTHDREGRASVTVDSDGDVNAFSERGN